MPSNSNQRPHTAELNDFGLFTLTEPRQGSRRKATIVAVHGLNGHYMRTWTNAQTDPPFLWIRDGLRVDLPDCRVLSYGYDASILAAPGRAPTSLLDHATNLHNLLQDYLQKEGPPHPILFIAHNAGGILVKQVLVQSALQVRSVIHDSTAAVFFFGTPHRGSTSTSMAHKLASLVAGASSVASLFSKDSAALQLTHESWMHLQQTYEIYSFYETRASSLGRNSTLIVTRGEATLNIPQERVVPLDASHRDMVKPSSTESPTYRSILHCLKSVLSHTAKLRPISPPPSVLPRPTSRISSITTVESVAIKGYTHIFRQNILEETKECSLSDLFTKSPGVLLDNLNDLGSDSDDPLIWTHVPVNNTSWVNPCLQNLISSRHGTLALSMMEQKYWQFQERKRKNIPHSRHFEPSCFHNNGSRNLQLVIYLPYLHWDSSECFAHRTKFLHETKEGVAVAIPEGLSEDERAVYKVIREDRGTSSLHPRRSLDQYFYSSLPDTSSRDQDQVVSKYMPKDGRGGRKMIMVDQLWLWYFESCEPDSEHARTSIFTSFPRKDRRSVGDDRDLELVADLRQAIIDEANSREGDWATSKIKFVGLIIEQAVNVMLRVRTEESLDFLSIFPAAIGEATESQTRYFRDFQEELQKGSKSMSNPETKREEVKLALELSDIMDELNSINRLFEAQREVLETVESICPSLYTGAGSKERYNALLLTLMSTRKDVEGYMKQVKRMIADAQRTQDSLKDLLDLQQKEETLNEAHYSNEQAETAREQADATEAQSQILFLFTIVTIIFAPLSFFTSYYGMNVREFTGEEGNINQSKVWKVMGPISAAIIFGLLGGAWYMYRDTQRQQRARRKARRNTRTN